MLRKIGIVSKQKEAVLKRVKELNNVKKAAKEAGVPWQLVSMWRKKADPSATKAAQKAVSKSKTVSKTAAKTTAKTKAPAKTSKAAKDTPASKLQIENAVLRTENNELKKQVARLQKAVRELM